MAKKGTLTNINKGAYIVQAKKGVVDWQTDEPDERIVEETKGYFKIISDKLGLEFESVEILLQELHRLEYITDAEIIRIKS